MEKKLVFVENDRPVTDSLTVADVFSKRHDNVMQDIRELGCSEEFSLLNFQESTYTNDRGRRYARYLMTEQGFVLLVMGYTGKEAMHFKEQYIAEFDRMREELRQAKATSPYKLPQSYKEALLALVEQVEKTEQLEAEKTMLQQCLAEAQPKVTYVDRILESKDTVLITQIAKDYGLSGRRLNAILHDEGVQYRVKGQWVLYWQHQDMGYTKSHTVEYNRSNGEKGTKIHTEWTQKGRLFIHDILSRRGIVPYMDREKAGTEVDKLVPFPSPTK